MKARGRGVSVRIYPEGVAFNSPGSPLRRTLASDANTNAYPKGVAQLGALNLPRDVTDVKFLNLAHETDADYLVTKDGRRLLRLKKYRRTRIVTPTQFLAYLS